MNVGLLGFGTVGASFYQLVQGRDDIQVTAVLSRRPQSELAGLATPDVQKILEDPSVDVVVEAIGGLHPAYEYVCAAIQAGKHVVTANKHLMVAYYDELVALTRERGICLRCTAAAAGGIPWLTSLSRAARLDELVAIEGILNGTTDYMLKAMTDRGADYEAALKEAQNAGLAEADPTADVEAFDPLRKLVLSINLAFGVSVKEKDIPRLGISSIQPEDIAAFKARGLVCKLFNRAESHGVAISAFVIPTLFASDAPQVYTNVSLYAKRFGRQSFSGAGIGPKPSAFSTGSSVLGDCLDIGEGCRPFYYVSESKPCSIDNSGVISRFYYRTGEIRGISDPMSVQDAFQWIEKTRRSEPGAFFARLYEEAQSPKGP